MLSTKPLSIQTAFLREVIGNSLQRTRLSTHIAIFLLLRELLQNLHETFFSPLFHADPEKLKEENVGCLKNHLKHKYLALSEQQREKANICVGTENKQRVWYVQKVGKEFCLKFFIGESCE